MKRSLLLALIIPAAFVLAWWAGFNLYGNDSGKRPSGQKTNVQVDVTPDRQTGQSATPETANPANPETVPTQAGGNDLAYLGWDIDSSADEPRVCFNFHADLSPNDNIKMRDYVDVSPKASITLQINGQDLCLTGFEFDKDYSVTLREGLPGKKNKSLARNHEENVSFGDKPAFVSFAGQGIILPRVNAQGLAIETINVDVVDAQISRVNDRIIARRNPQSGKVTLEGDYGWEYEDAASSVRETVWSGEVSIKNIRNKKVTTVIDFAGKIGDLPPGAYVVSIIRKHDDNEDRPAKAWRWIISTDLALTSYQGADGLTVSVRSIDTAKLQPGVDVTLVAQNNDILATVKTDASGHVNFPAPILNGKGAKRAKMVMAYGADNDYAILDLDRAALDLSEYDIAGRKPAKNADVYAYTERGVYRPGETAHVTVMLRDNAANVLTGRPVTLNVFRPNGIKMFSQKIEASDIADKAGTITWDYEIPTSAPRGMWSVGVEVEGIGRAGGTEFSVEDFVPQKLKLAIKADPAPIGRTEIRDVSVDAQFLYGAPGAALETEAAARIRLDPKPFAEFEDYHFGPASRDFSERFVDMGQGLTDGNGIMTFALDMKSANVSSPFPLRAEITAGVAEPGGRFVRDSIRVPLRTQESYIGIDPLYDGRRAPRGKPAGFNLVALNRLGKPIDKTLSWTLVEEDWDYHWYRERGRWRYRRDVRDLPLTSGKLDVAAGAPATWSQLLKWGDYRLDITSDDGSVAGHRFSVGWGRAETSDSPDQLRIGSSQSSVKAGETVKLAINAPYAGEGELVIANDAVRLVKPLRLNEGASELSFNFAPEWGDSVYAMLTLYTPREVKGRPVPRRAVGISYIALDRSDQTLNLSINTPEVIRPRQEHVFTVDVKNGPRGETVWMNFAAVDEGILQITKYKSPDAAGVFFGKKALGVDIRDDYGRMLNPNLGAPAIAKSGGDSLGGEGLTVVPTKTVSIFTGPVKVKGGKAKVSLTMPDFNGELRLMATAWTASAVGSASGAVKVRDKVPAIVGLPRFLAPADRAFATVSLDNVEGEKGTYDAVLSSTNNVQTGDKLALGLNKGQRLEGRINIAAGEIGIDTLSLDVKGPGGYEAVSTFPIQVRTPFMPVTTSKFERIDPGQSLTLRPDLVTGFVPGSTDITVSFSHLPGLDPAPYVDSLARYPYGCTEQTVSTAMPLLYATDLGGIPGQSVKDRRRGVQKAINKLASRQSLDGAFGLWREGDKYARPWLGVYATDFMFRAKAEGYYVSDDVLTRARTAIAELSRMPRYPNLQYNFGRRNSSITRRKVEVAAYAHFVLAREGRGNLGHMRYLYDNHRGKIKTPLAHAYLGGALSMMGDKARSKAAFKAAADGIGYEDNSNYYQSALRDIGGTISAAAESSNDTFAADMAEAFRDEIMDETWLNTQEKAYVILGLKSLMKSATAPKISAKNASLGGEKVRPFASLYGGDLEEYPTFENRDKNAVWASVTVSGAPADAPLPMAEGFVLEKQLFTMDGAPLERAAVKQGEQFVTRVRFSSDMNRSRTIVLADLLPAGFEIETILRSTDGDQKNGVKGAYDWLGPISDFQVTEARDDRFIASLETYRKDQYVAAYIVRAVTLGDFVQPGAVLEDMYRPADRAITQTKRITINVDPAL